MTYSGSKEGMSLPEVTVNVSGKVLDSPEMDEWDDKQVCLCVGVCLCVSGGGGGGSVTYIHEQFTVKLL